MNDFISIHDLQPSQFDLCDVKISGSDTIITECRYAKYDDGTVAWVCPRMLLSAKAVSDWKLNSLHSDELTKAWLHSLEHRDDRPDIEDSDITGNFTYNRKV